MLKYNKEWYQKNKEKIKQRQKLYKQLHPDKIKTWRKNYKNAHKEKVKSDRIKFYKDNPNYNSAYYEKNKNRIHERNRIWRINHSYEIKKYRLEYGIKNKVKISRKAHEYYLRVRDRRRQYDREYYKRHKTSLLEYQKQYYNKNLETKLKYSRDYGKNHPEQRLKHGIEYHKKYGSIFNLDSYQYKFVLGAWSDVVQKRDNHKCQVCGEPSKHAHHILHKKYCPQLSLNPNNGIALCIKHHNEVHGKCLMVVRQ